MKLYTLIVGILLLFSGCTKKDQYSVGQEWNYKTRPTEKSSTLTILKIEEYPETGKVIHISISGLKVKDISSTTGFADKFTHIPISEEALGKSVTSLKNETGKSQTLLNWTVILTGKKSLIKEMPGYLLFLFLRL
jgi:PBP1b-binding outer membrane lipoprotein LpoB